MVNWSYFLPFFLSSTSSSLDFSFLDIHQTARDIAMMSKIRKATNLVSLKSTIISPITEALHQSRRTKKEIGSMTISLPLLVSIHPIQEESHLVLEHAH